MNNSACCPDRLYSELSRVSVPVSDGTFFERHDGSQEVFIHSASAALLHFSYLMLHSFMHDKLTAIQQILLFDPIFLERSN